jgi:hypothetical protein
VKVYILSFDDWVKFQVPRVAGTNPTELAKLWIIAFAESLCLLRRDLAPIDEPADAWVAALENHAGKWA